MGVLQRFERRLEGLVNGAFAKAFKAEVQPVEIASALQRECDDRAAIVSRGRTMVPNEFVVELGRRDHERLSPYAEPLGAELGDMVAEHAEDQHYTFVGPVAVAFELVEGLDTGVFRVRSNVRAEVTPAYADDTSAARRVGAESWVEIDGARHHLTRRVTTIGRGTDTDLRIDDPGVSRRHAEIHLDDGGANVVDLGSTNGTLVDGSRVPEARLEEGTRISIGSTTIVYRRTVG